MKKISFSFRQLALIGVFLFGALAFAHAATPPPGKVTKVNQSDHTFTVHWTIPDTHHRFNQPGSSSHERTFKTNEKTTYWVGKTKGSFSDIQQGVLVNVKAHSEGADRVADNVQIIKSS